MFYIPRNIISTKLSRRFQCPKETLVKRVLNVYRHVRDIIQNKTSATSLSLGH